MLVMPDDLRNVLLPLVQHTCDLGCIIDIDFNSSVHLSVVAALTRQISAILPTFSALISRLFYTGLVASYHICTEIGTS